MNIYDHVLGTMTGMLTGGSIDSRREAQKRLGWIMTATATEDDQDPIFVFALIARKTPEADIRDPILRAGVIAWCGFERTLDLRDLTFDTSGQKTGCEGECSVCKKPLPSVWGVMVCGGCVAKGA